MDSTQATEISELKQRVATLESQVKLLEGKLNKLTKDHSDYKRQQEVDDIARQANMQ